MPSTTATFFAVPLYWPVTYGTVGYAIVDQELLERLSMPRCHQPGTPLDGDRIT